LSITTPSVSDEFSAEYFYASSATIGLPKISSLKRLSGCEYWSLTHPNTATTQVTIAWVSGDCLPAAEYVSNPLFLTVSYWNGTKWADAGQNNVSGTAASGTVRSNSTSTSGYFTLASTDVVNALPVELGDVTARALKSSVQVLWKTFSENHTHVFEIQRADSTLLFASIGKVDAAGDSKQTIDYDFIDMLPSAGMNYYRIRAVDLDGSIAYSRVVAARYESDGALILFPNPVRQGEEIRISKRGRLRVIDPVKGTMIMDISNQDVIPTKGLSPGIYFAIDGQNVYNRFIVY
jgi:hypothetical protein